MATTVLEQYRVSDLLDWYEQKQLILNPHFQRRTVWSPQAKVFLIDTILRQLPVPKVYMRTKVDLSTKKSIREIVDGQQRLRAIVDFAHGKFALTNRAKEFSGFSYKTLPEALQEQFLSYPIAVDQLINASDSDVLEIFARLNVYNVKLNSAELRHAQYQGNLKWSIHESARKADSFWEKYQVLTVNNRLRMLDDSLMAEMYSIILRGVTDGGQTLIDRFYKENDPILTEDECKGIATRVTSVLDYLDTNLGEALVGGTAIAKAPHLLMLFAAVAHAMHGIPDGDLSDLPPSHPEWLSSTKKIEDRLAQMNELLTMDHEDGFVNTFQAASSSSTQRIKSRAIRFPIYYLALEP